MARKTPRIGRSVLCYLPQRRLKRSDAVKPITGLFGKRVAFGGDDVVVGREDEIPTYHKFAIDRTGTLESLNHFRLFAKMSSQRTALRAQRPIATVVTFLRTQ